MKPCISSQASHIAAHTGLNSQCPIPHSSSSPYGVTGICWSNCVAALIAIGAKWGLSNLAIFKCICPSITHCHKAKDLIGKTSRHMERKSVCDIDEHCGSVEVMHHYTGGLFSQSQNQAQISTCRSGYQI